MRAVIVGAGIAGPVLGVFLRRIGIDVAICEARPSAASEEGGFLGVAPNGMRVLSAIGVDGAVRERGAPAAGMAFLDARGKRLGAIDARDDAARYGSPLVMVRRGDLHAVLVAAAARAGAQIHFGARLADLDRSDPRVVAARFEDGREELADMVIGCDGIRSRTRALALPDAPAPEFLRMLDFGGYGRSDAPLEVGWNTFVFGRRAFFGAFRRPDGEIWWFHNSGEREPVRDLEPEARRARILALHERDPSWIADVVRSTPAIFGPWPLHDIVSIPTWHAGRVCVIGDAAHATSPSAGQGASLAMEDAMMLARCLRDAGLEPEPAFARLEGERRARVEAVVKRSRRNGSPKSPSNALAAWTRDLLLPLFLKLGTSGQRALYEYRIDWEPAA